MHIIHLPEALLQLSALIGVVFPLIPALIRQDHFSRKTNVVITVLLAILAAVVICAAQAKLNVHDLVGSFMALYITAHVFYEGLWKPTGVTATIQSATSVPTPPPAPVTTTTTAPAPIPPPQV